MPFLEGDAPECAEDDDRRHMQSPTRKIVSPHLCRAHAVKEKLEVPRDPGCGTQDVIDGQRPLFAPSGRNGEVLTPGPVLEVQRETPDTIRREPAKQNHNQYGQVLPQRRGAMPDG